MTKQKTDFYPEVWKEFLLKDNQLILFQFNRKAIWLRRRNEALYLAEVENDNDGGYRIIRDPEPPGDEIPWEQYITRNREFRFQPRTPDQPLILRPLTPVAILPEVQIHYHVAIPLWAGLTPSRVRGNSIFRDVELNKLSHTWFGPPSSGEFCYFWEHPLEAELDEAQIEPAWAICPLTIRNNSKSLLKFERFCIRSLYLSLYAGSQSLWTNEVKVTFKGAEQTSHISFSSRHPSTEKSMRLLSPPRVPPEQQILKRSFDFFKYFTSY